MVQEKEKKHKPGFRFHPRLLELVRKYAWSGEKRALLYRYFELKTDHTIVDVGCGSGAFTRVIAERLDSKKGGKIVGLDRNEELLKEARKIANRDGFGDKISFKKCDAIKRIPLPDNYADRVCCQAFLWLMTDDQRALALKEMIRVCKPGGLIGACEGSLDTGASYTEANARFGELTRKFYNAEAEGFRKKYGYDRKIGYKLPTLFRWAGLERVRLDGVTHTYLSCDDRIPLDYKIAIRKDAIRYPSQVLAKLSKLRSITERKAFMQKMEPSRMIGGISYPEILEYFELKKSINQRLVENPKLLDEDTSVDTGISFITTGLKPKSMSFH